jgi:glutamate-5-semialdehyde dehydrogenase
MTTAFAELTEKAAAAKAASKKLAFLGTDVKNKAVLAIADALLAKEGEILSANNLDYQAGVTAGMSAPMLDRLKLDHARLSGMAADVRTVAGLPDPVGAVSEMRTLPNGLVIGKRSVPLGVIGAIYESRPNVTVDIAVLCLKSGNGVILRGGKEAGHSIRALGKVIQGAAYGAGVPEGAIQVIESADRALVNQMLKLKGVIDLIIPRGGAELIKNVAENAAMAVVTGGIGVCHTYIDRFADLAKAVPIIYNAKVQRPTVCNALDCILIHKEIASLALPAIARELAKAKVELRCDERALAILKPVAGVNAVKANNDDWGKEFLALVLAVKIVDSADEAIRFIADYSSGHSEACLTEDYGVAMRFLNEVDAACVYVNASTRFTDGGQFGMGAEVGISTQKFHARGPMGLKELTSYKWIIFGSGQIRE